MMSLLSYFDKSLEAFVFGHQVLVEVYSFIVAAAKPSIHPLHAFTIGSWELWQNLTEIKTQVSHWCSKMSRAEGKDFSAFMTINWLFLLHFAIYHKVKANDYYFFLIHILFKANNNKCCHQVVLKLAMLAALWGYGPTYSSCLILHPSHLANQDVSYPADDEAPVQAPSLQLALPFPLQQAEEVLRVKL